MVSTYSKLFLFVIFIFIFTACSIFGGSESDQKFENDGYDSASPLFTYTYNFDDAMVILPVTILDEDGAALPDYLDGHQGLGAFKITSDYKLKAALFYDNATEDPDNDTQSPAFTLYTKATLHYRDGEPNGASFFRNPAGDLFIRLPENVDSSCVLNQYIAPNESRCFYADDSLEIEAPAFNNQGGFDSEGRYYFPYFTDNGLPLGWARVEKNATQVEVLTTSDEFISEESYVKEDGSILIKIYEENESDIFGLGFLFTDGTYTDFTASLGVEVYDMYKDKNDVFYALAKSIGDTTEGLYQITPNIADHTLSMNLIQTLPVDVVTSGCIFLPNMEKELYLLCEEGTIINTLTSPTLVNHNELIINDFTTQVDGNVYARVRDGFAYYYVIDDADSETTDDGNDDGYYNDEHHTVSLIKINLSDGTQETIWHEEDGGLLNIYYFWVDENDAIIFTGRCEDVEVGMDGDCIGYLHPDDGYAVTILAEDTNWSAVPKVDYWEF